MSKAGVSPASPAGSKEGLPWPQAAVSNYPHRAQSRWQKAALAIACLTFVGFWRLRSEFHVLPTEQHLQVASQPPQCAQQKPWLPSDRSPTLPTHPSAYFAELLSSAVQVDTTVQDDWGPLTANSTKEVKEKYKTAFAPFEAYLERAFPAVHETLQKEIVNEHGLLFTWQGSERDLKPLVLMAHQDVVPVEPTTLDQWTHPPFDGFIDKENGLVWGRGASDDKACLITVLAALESLVSSDLSPRRTIVASFGFNEESTGASAAALADFLVERYGSDGAELIVDEGMEVIGRDTAPSQGGIGLAWAGPGTSEKGYLDARIVVSTPGGHSSQPPKHTGIGYLSRLVAVIEDNAPQPRLDSLDHPALAPFLCLREAPEIKKRKHLYSVLRDLAALASSTSYCHARKNHLLSRFLNALTEEEIVAFKTTQAVDLISGGVKINALPERSTATINYRIDFNQRVDELKTWLADLVEQQSRALGLDFAGWKEESVSSSKQGARKATTSRGTVHLEVAYDSALEASPRTPTSGDEAGAWRLLSSVIRSTWKDIPGQPEGIQVVPNGMEGNTDTKSYWKLSKNIFRFSPGSILPNPAPKGSSIHTVDENAQIAGLEDAHRFYANLILAVQD